MFEFIVSIAAIVYLYRAFPSVSKEISFNKPTEQKKSDGTSNLDKPASIDVWA